MELIDLCQLAEQTQRHLLDLLQSSLSALKVTDVGPVRALIIIRMDAEELSATELKWSCYVGSNVTYNLKKLIEAGYVATRPGYDDKRLMMVSLSAKGVALRSALMAMNADVFGAVNPERLNNCGETLRVLQGVLVRARDRASAVPNGLAA